MKTGFNPLLKLVDSVVVYDPVTGAVKMKRNNRPVYPDYDGMVSIWISSQKKLVKIKLDKLCYYLAYARLPSSTERLLHRNLDEEDNSLKNLVIVPKDKYFEIKEAILNLGSLLKIVPHKYDQYMYVVQYKQGKKFEKVVCNDIIAAQEEERKLRLMFIKLITKYCNTEQS